MNGAPKVENPAGKVAGYTAQPDAKVALVNSFKEDEERLLRKIDALVEALKSSDGFAAVPRADARWLAIARTHFQEGWMALNRAVFQPTRIKLPEDDATAEAIRARLNGGDGA